MNWGMKETKQNEITFCMSVGIEVSCSRASVLSRSWHFCPSIVSLFLVTSSALGSSSSSLIFPLCFVLCFFFFFFGRKREGKKETLIKTWSFDVIFTTTSHRWIASAFTTDLLVQPSIQLYTIECAQKGWKTWINNLLSKMIQTITFSGFHSFWFGLWLRSSLQR